MVSRMPDAPILLTLTCGLLFAVVLGAVCHRLRVSPIVGYLLAGVVVGPRTPGFDADVHVAEQFAEIGIILLMFGVGLEFHVADLRRVQRVALPGALLQVAITTALVAAIFVEFGWGWGAAVILGLAASVASTVVLVRSLESRGGFGNEAGQTAVGWLVLEDALTVLIVVLLPALAPTGHAGGWQQVAGSGGLALLKMAVLVALTLGFGRLVLPRALYWVAETRSRELFTLSVLSIALGIATGAAVFLQVSVALGAFLAGLVVGQSDVSHRAAADALPLRDAFAVLFFVSIGMRLDLATVWREPGPALALLSVVLLGKPLIATGLVLLFGRPVGVALTVGAALGQIGEFSFILSDLATRFRLLPEPASSLLVATAVASIALNPLILAGTEPLARQLDAKRRASPGSPVEAALFEADSVGAVLVGFGPAGRVLCRRLEAFAIRPVVIEMNLSSVQTLRARGIPAIHGDATRRTILEAAGVATARYLLVTVPDSATRDVIIREALACNPGLKVFARARFLQEVGPLQRAGVAGYAIEEEEVAVALASRFLRELGEPRAEEGLERVRRHLLADEGLG